MMAHFAFLPPCDAEPLFEPLIEQELEDLQTQLGTALPEDFLQFLREWNGIAFSGTTFDQQVQFPLRDSSDKDECGSVYRLFGLTKEKDLDDLRFAGESYHFSRRVPKRFMLIGDNGSWDGPCISLAGEDYGEIYYWSPGEGWPPEEEVASMDYLWWVAKSFSQFWSLLKVVAID